MEIKAQEKLKEINQAYERLCKNRGAEASADPDATGEAKKARKPAASDDDEKATPKQANSRKAEEGPHGRFGCEAARAQGGGSG